MMSEKQGCPEERLGRQFRAILPRYGSTNVIADVGVPLQIVNPTTSFGCGPTDRNSYVFAWTNAVVGRIRV